MADMKHTSKIMHLVISLDTGGLERVVIDLINGNDDRRLECHLGCLSHPGERRDDVRPNGFWCGSERINSSILDLRVLWSLRRYILNNEIDLIHSHNPVPHRYGIAASLLTGVPLVHTKHGRNYPDNAKGVWLNRQLARFSKTIVTVSDDAHQVGWQVEKITREILRCIPNGIDTDRFTPVPSDLEKQRLRRALKLPEDAFIIGSVGRLAPEKNHSMLVDSFTRCSRQHPNCFLVIVGDGPERRALESQIVAGGIHDRAVLAGKQTNVVDWMRCCDAFVLTSRTEGTPITLLEAGACGLPAVATDVGGTAEIIEPDTTGTLVAPDDRDGLVVALLSLAGNAEMRRRMGTMARERIVKHYSLPDTLSAYNRVYHDALA